MINTFDTSLFEFKVFNNSNHNNRKNDIPLYSILIENNHKKYAYN